MKRASEIETECFLASTENLFSRPTEFPIRAQTKDLVSSFSVREKRKRRFQLNPRSNTWRQANFSVYQISLCRVNFIQSTTKFLSTESLCRNDRNSVNRKIRLPVSNQGSNQGSNRISPSPTSLQLTANDPSTTSDRFCFLRALHARRRPAGRTRGRDTTESQVGWEFRVSSDTPSLRPLFLSESDDIRGRGRCALPSARRSRGAAHRALSESPAPRPGRSNRGVPRVTRFFG